MIANLMLYGLEQRHAPPRSALLSHRLDPGAHCFHSDVIFGAPSADCRGTGICKIVAHGMLQLGRTRSACRQSEALFTKGTGGEGVAMYLFRELLCINIYRNHLREGVLTLHESCPLPRSMVNYLKLEIHALPPGAYPVELHQGYMRILFT